MIKTTKQIVPLDYAGLNLGQALEVKQEQVVQMGFVAPNKRVNAILELERLRIAYVRTERRTIDAMNSIDDELRQYQF